VRRKNILSGAPGGAGRFLVAAPEKARLRLRLPRARARARVIVAFPTLRATIVGKFDKFSIDQPPTSARERPCRPYDTISRRTLAGIGANEICLHAEFIDRLLVSQSARPMQHNLIDNLINLVFDQASGSRVSRRVCIEARLYEISSHGDAAISDTVAARA